MVQDFGVITKTTTLCYRNALVKSKSLSIYDEYKLMKS